MRGILVPFTFAFALAISKLIRTVKKRLTKNNDIEFNDYYK